MQGRRWVAAPRIPRISITLTELMRGMRGVAAPRIFRILGAALRIPAILGSYRALIPPHAAPPLSLSRMGPGHRDAGCAGGGSPLPPPSSLM